MDSSVLVETVNVLKRLNAEIENEALEIDLPKLFETCQNLQSLIEKSSLASNDKLFQESISVCIAGLENCTRMVNNLELFSCNESVEDLQTSSIRYFLLPAMLGCLNLSLQSTDLSIRMKNIETAEVYFKDFLVRCTNYDICKDSLKYFKESLVTQCSNDNSSTASLSAAREKKMQIYKHKKDLVNREESLKPALQRLDLEESVREYYFVLLEKWILISTEELESVKKEVNILKDITTKGKLPMKNAQEPKDVKPLKPFIITKNAMQKQVFGLGYPSYPVLTVDDFYRQRFEKAVEEHKQNTPGNSLQDAAARGEGLKNEAEEIEKEELQERDDPDALAKARQWDDWKDENPRGSGNRYNKG